RADEALRGAAAREPAPPRLGQPAGLVQALPRSRDDPAPSSARARNRLGAPRDLGVGRARDRANRAGAGSPATRPRPLLLGRDHEGQALPRRRRLLPGGSEYGRSLPRRP